MVRADYRQTDVGVNRKTDRFLYQTAYMKKTFGQRIRAARKDKRLSQKALAARVGMSQPNLSELESDKYPSSSFTPQLASVLGVRALWLAEERGPKDIAAPNTNEIVAEVRRVPIISWVQAGDWASVVDNFHPGEADEWIETTVPIHRHTYALRVRGDSMMNPSGEPTFLDGQVIVVEPDLIDEPANLVGRLVIVKRANDNDATFKQLVRDAGKFYLKPLNPAYPLLELKEGDVFCGVVREKRIRYV